MPSDKTQVDSGSGRKPCVGCGKIHGSENGHINCLNDCIAGLRLRVKRQQLECDEKIASLKVANRAAVEAAMLSVSKGGQTEALQMGKK